MTVLKISGVYTSTIGSFPLADTIANRRRCIEDLLTAKVDYPAYPQLADMGAQFLDDLAQHDCGIISMEGRYKLKGEGIDQTVSPPGLAPFFWTIQYLEENGLKTKVKLKAAITGPFTLASYIETKSGMFPFNTAVSDPELVRQLARIISKSCEKMSKEASMISVDEPILGVIVGARTSFGYPEDEIIEVYNGLRKACGDTIVGTHICGRISPRLANILLRTDLDFLSHEFWDTPKNTEVYASNKLKESGKVLSVGCLSTKNPKLESPEEILRQMNKFRRYGDSLIFTPDCGFRKLIVSGLELEEAYKISMRKLRNMVEAARKFRDTNC